MEMTDNDLRLAILRAKQHGDKISRDIVKLMDAAAVCEGLPGGTITIEALKASAQVLLVKLEAAHVAMNTLAAARAEMQEA